MTALGRAHGKRSSAVLVYVLVIFSLQVFFLVVTVEAFQADEEALAWPAAALSVGLFATAALFSRVLQRD